MNQTDNQIQQWVKTAVSGIRFWVDREGVEKELRGHLEDKTGDLMELFSLSEEEAQSRAVSAMGDAEEVSRALAKIHTPWLGYLLTASEVLVGLLCALLLVILFSFGEDAFLGDDQGMEFWDFDNLPAYYERYYLPSDDPNQLMTEEYRDQKVKINGQNISLRRGALWQDGKNQVLYLYLRLDTWRCWERGHLNADWLTVTDSLGNQVDFSAWGTDGNVNSLQIYGRGEGPFHQGYQLILGDLHPDTQWVRLDYGFTQTVFALTADLTEEGGA